MRAARWTTGIGSVILFLTGIGHETRLGQLQEMIQASAVKPPLDAIVKACWLAFGGEMAAIAVIALVASMMDRGARIVLTCAATMIFNGALLFHFVGPFFGVYVSLVVAVLFLAGGLMQAKQPA